MSVFSDALHLGHLVTISGMAAMISRMVLTKCVEEEDSGSAWIGRRCSGLLPSLLPGSSGGWFERPQG
jgi:hypothetical protein